MIKSAHRVDREFHVIRALNATNVPVPKAYVLCEDTSVIGTSFYVMEFKKGRIFKDTMLRSIPKDERKFYWFALIEAAAKLHTADFKAIGLATFGKNGDYYPRQIRSLSRVSKIQCELSNARWIQEPTATHVNPLRHRIKKWKVRRGHLPFHILRKCAQSSGPPGVYLRTGSLLFMGTSKLVLIPVCAT